jgi:hypothetical protein
MGSTSTDGRDPYIVNGQGHWVLGPASGGGIVSTAVAVLFLLRFHCLQHGHVGDAPVLLWPRPVSFPRNIVQRALLQPVFTARHKATVSRMGAVI